MERDAQEQRDQARLARLRFDQARRDRARRERDGERERDRARRDGRRERDEVRDARALLDANGITDKASLNRWRLAGNHPDKVSPQERLAVQVRFQEVTNAWNIVDAHTRAHFFGE
jgi:hypothetical protein